MDYLNENALYKNNFMAVFSTLVNKLESIKSQYDIILTDCNGYNNLVCDYANKNQKSCICIGEVMRMYFGVINEEWAEHCKDILLLFKNKFIESVKRSQAKAKAKAEALAEADAKKKAPAKKAAPKKASTKKTAPKKASE